MLLFEAFHNLHIAVRKLVKRCFVNGFGSSVLSTKESVSVRRSEVFVCFSGSKCK